MQDSWQVFMKPGMSAPHVDTAFQAAATTSMAGRVMFPFSRWSDIGETDGGTHGKHAGSNLAPHTTANAVQNSAEGHGDCKVSSGLVDVTQQSTKLAVQSSASGLVCTTEAKKAGHTTATQHSFGTMAVATAGGGMKADHGHIASAFSSSASSLIGRMTQIDHINDMNIKQMLNRDGMNEQEINKKIITQDNAKNDMQSNNKILQGDGGVSNSKCKQHPTVHTVPRCQIDGCKQDLSQAKKEYHRRHKVCEMHSKASSVLKCGLHQRFCQQCSRFHVVGDFDDAKRSCRRRLEGHNRRRRKSISQGYGNLIGMNSVMHRQLMAATAMMMPLQQVLSNQGQSNEVANNIQQIKYDQKLDMPSNTLPTNFDERLLALLNYNTKGSSSSTSSSSSPSPSPIFNHGDTTCALSLLSCHASLDQPLHRNIEDNCLNPNLSNNQTINNYFTFPNTKNLASITSLKANKSSEVEYPYSSKFIHPPTTTGNSIESISFVESTKDLPYAYSVANYLKHLGPLESLEQHYNANIIAELLRQHQAYSNPNPHI